MITKAHTHEADRNAACSACYGLAVREASGRRTTGALVLRSLSLSLPDANTLLDALALLEDRTPTGSTAYFALLALTGRVITTRDSINDAL